MGGILDTRRKGKVWRRGEGGKREERGEEGEEGEEWRRRRAEKSLLIWVFAKGHLGWSSERA